MFRSIEYAFCSRNKSQDMPVFRAFRFAKMTTLRKKSKFCEMVTLFLVIVMTKILVVSTHIAEFVRKGIPLESLDKDMMVPI
jgi:hypothetical protein